MRRRLPISSRSFWRNTGGGIRRNICSAKVTAPRGRRCFLDVLETDRDVDFNGMILLSQILNFNFSADGPEFNPGVELPYQLALPTYAASAWYHHKLPDAPKELAPLLAEVEHFAMTDYAQALEAGSALPAEQRKAIVAKLHQYTGLPVEYIQKADLRISGGEF